MSHSANHDQSRLLRVAPDLLAFVLGLGLAYVLKWETKDLVWSLWLCSLGLGYLTILSVIGGGACFGIFALRQKEFTSDQRLPAVLFGGGLGIFILVFFSVHFCGFHAGHSVFLQSFFPIDGMPKDGFGQAFMNPPLLRMHLLIFFFAFSHFLKIDSFVVFAVVYAVYFFPWNEVKNLWTAKTAPVSEL